MIKDDRKNKDHKININDDWKSKNNIITTRNYRKYYKNYKITI